MEREKRNTRARRTLGRRETPVVSPGPGRGRTMAGSARVRGMGACVLAALIGTTTPLFAAEGGGYQALTTDFLKVCADPSNLPFSNEALEGFENRVVELVAEELGVEVRYTWYPQSTGFVRNTLRVRECDLISGITTTSGQVQNTNPYYHSAYSMVYRDDSDIEATVMDDPDLLGKRLGVVAGTPPADILARLGLLGSVRPYQLVTDTRRERPAEQAIEDLIAGEIDVAFIWGPIAGYHASRRPEAGLVVVPLLGEAPDVRMNFSVSMAVRYNETDWKRTINRALDAREAEIVEVLRDYGVPLLNSRGELLESD